jgi:lambda family phage portal protein
MSEDSKSRFDRMSMAIGSVLDRAVFTINPKAGNRRMAARRQREVNEAFHERRMARLSAGGFDSAKKSPSGITYQLSPDAALEYDLGQMRVNSNMAYKNCELFAGHVERRVRRVAGTGIMMAPQIVPVVGKITEDQAKEWNTVLRSSFERWAHKAGGSHIPFYMIQRQVVRHIQKDGVAFVQFGDVYQADPRIPITLRLKVIHPTRVETPPEFAADRNVRLGVRTNPKNNTDILGYYVRTVIPGDNKRFEYKHEFVEAFYANGLPRMVHICESREAEQTLGYPQGQVALKRFEKVEEYEEAETERVIVASCHVGVVVGAADSTEAAMAAASRTDSRGRLIEELSPGRMEYAPDAESVIFNNPPGPTNTFVPFIEHQNRMAAAGLGTSYEMMSGNWGGVSYSGGKLIWVDEQSPIDSEQLDLIELLLIPTWQHVVNRCVISGVIEVSTSSFRREPHIYEAIKFVPPKRPSIDPARERAAAHADVAAGITLHADEVEQMNGRPSEDVYADVKRNIPQLAEIGITLDMLRAKGGTPLGGTNDTAAVGGEGRQKREAVGAA